MVGEGAPVTIRQDELWLSAIARFASRYPGVARAEIGRMIFGSRSASPHPLYPAVNKTSAAMFDCSAEDVLKKHTLLSLHLPFLEQHARDHVTSCALSGGVVSHLLGICPSGLSGPRYLRICPECAADDINLLGERCWYRSHQIRTFIKCWRHGCWLQETDQLAESSHGPTPWPLADTARVTRTFRLSSDPSGFLLLAARECTALLNNELSAVPRNGLRDAYLWRLDELGYTHKNGRIALERLTNAFASHFGPEVIELLGPRLSPENRDNWLLRLLRRPRWNQHPVRHIALSSFLGWNLSAAFSAAKIAPRFSRTTRSPQRRNQARPERVKEKRNDWLRILASNEPGPLRSHHDALYSWLWRNDRDWLLSHRPKRRAATHSQKVDWDYWDRILARRLVLASRKLRRSGRRVTRIALARASGHKGWLIIDNPRLPQATRTLARLVESGTEFACRRIAHVIAHQPAMKNAKPWRICTAASVGPELARCKTIADTIKNATRGH